VTFRKPPTPPQSTQARPGVRTTPKLPTPKESIEQAPENTGISPLMRLMQGKERPYRELTLPGFEEEDDAAIVIVSLTDLELAEARLEALSWLTLKKKMPEWLLETELGQSMLDNEIQSQILYRALRQPKMRTAHYAGSVNEIRMFMEPDQRLALWNEFVAFQHERNPLRAIHTDEELQEIIATLGKESSASGVPDGLTYLDSASLRSIVTELANLVMRQTKQLYSLTSQPNP
jgi:hypothetical protein